MIKIVFFAVIVEIVDLTDYNDIPATTNRNQTSTFEQFII